MSVPTYEVIWSREEAYRAIDAWLFAEGIKVSKLELIKELTSLGYQQERRGHHRIPGFELICIYKRHMYRNRDDK
jgi:hypothetical protein